MLTKKGPTMRVAMPALTGARLGEDLMGGPPPPPPSPLAPDGSPMPGFQHQSDSCWNVTFPRPQHPKSLEKVLHPQILTSTSPTAPWPRACVLCPQKAPRAHLHSAPHASLVPPTGQDGDEAGPYILSQWEQRHREGKRLTHRVSAS